MQKAILIGMPKTQGQRDLPFVEKELELLEECFGSQLSATKMIYPTRKTVLSTLRDYQIVHFSCHGISLAEDPSQSKLLLEDWQTTPLTVSDILSMNIHSSQLAYLSACHTASTRNLKLLDESINLSSAIQLAGFPSVVGTLWQVEDKYSADVALDVYRWMLNGSSLETFRSAEALHRTICALRDQTRFAHGWTKKNPKRSVTLGWIHTYRDLISNVHTCEFMTPIMF